MTPNMSHFHVRKVRILPTNPLSVTSCHTIGMVHNADMSIDDAEALRVRREDLYAFMQEITAAALMLPQPETYIEAERAVRTIATADRLIHQFDLTKPNDEATAGSPAPWSPAAFRKGLRMLADRMMAAAKTIPVPDTALTALRALRYARSCDRMLTQLYAPPKPKPAPARPAEPTKPPRSRADLHEEFLARVADIKRRIAPGLARRKEEARKSGFWHDGRPYIPEDEPSEPPHPSTAETDLNPHPEISEGQDENPSGQMPNQHDPP